MAELGVGQGEAGEPGDPIDLEAGAEAEAARAEGGRVLPPEAQAVAGAG